MGRGRLVYDKERRTIVPSPSFESWRCQTCGAHIGYVGRFFQRLLGCFLVRSRKCKRRT